MVERMERIKDMKKVLVLGAGGFIGSHLVKSLKEEGSWVQGVDLKYPEYWNTYADEFIIGDLRDPNFVNECIDFKFDEVYQLAADMGGIGYISNSKYDASIMTNSALININVLQRSHQMGIEGVFYSSSACIYPEHNQINIDDVTCEESSAYPANPDTEYGWEKLFSERLYLAYNKSFNMNNKIARYHNVFGPYGTWDGGKEKAPAAICRKIVLADKEIEVWGDGEQRRSFLYVDECVEGTINLMRSKDFNGPVNIGSERMISINNLVDIVAKISGKNIYKKYVEGPKGVNARVSDNNLINKELGWVPKENLEYGLEETYFWIARQIKDNLL
jgi:nucleoside-diphosphate-sugar epimerase